MVTDMQEVSVKKEQYSFSKLSSWWTCPYGYKLRYIDHQAGIGNAFSSYGTLVHDIMERYAKGELKLNDLATIYEWEFDVAVPENFPWNKFVNLRESYYNAGLDFLKTFKGYDGYKILGVEEEFKIPIDDWMFVGIADLIFEDSTGKLIIRDYKSKATFKNDDEKRKYARQLYLYSLYVKEKYGRYPDELQFMMFRKKKIESIVFNHEDMDEAVEWAKWTVGIIRETFDYPTTCEEFYADNLCNHREYCQLKPPKKARRTRKK